MFELTDVQIISYNFPYSQLIFHDAITRYTLQIIFPMHTTHDTYFIIILYYIHNSKI